MNAYVLGGYVVVIGSIGGYAASLVARLNSAQRRVQMNARNATTKVSGNA